MKRWKIILISVISALAIIIGGGVCIFHFFVVPRYVDPLLKTAAQLLDDEDVRREISALAQEFTDKGLLDDELLKQYLDAYGDLVQKDNAKAQKSPGSDKNSMSANDIQVNENVSGKRYSYGKKKPSNSLVEVEEKTDTTTTSEFEKSLYQRIMKNVSQEDLARGYELAAKFDIEKVRSLIHNRKALKEYVRSVLTESEYAEVVGFYLKYSYILEDM